MEVEYKGPPFLKDVVDRFYQKYSQDYPKRNVPLTISLEYPLYNIAHEVINSKVKQEMSLRIENSIRELFRTGFLAPKKNLEKILVLSGVSTNKKLTSEVLALGSAASYNIIKDEIIISPIFVFYSILNKKQRKKLRNEFFDILDEMNYLVYGGLAHETVHWALGDAYHIVEARRIFEPVRNIAFDIINLQNMALSKEGYERLNLFFNGKIPETDEECDKIIGEFVDTSIKTNIYQDIINKREKLEIVPVEEAAAYNFGGRKTGFISRFKKWENIYVIINTWIHEIGKHDSLILLKELINKSWENEIPLPQLIMDKKI